MALVVIISVLVQFYYLILNTNAVDVPESVLFNITSNNTHNFTTNEYVKVKLRVTEDENRIVSKDCKGVCMVNIYNKKLYDSCKITKDGNYNYLDVSLAGNLTREDSGGWKCIFQFKKTKKNTSENVTKEINKTKTYVFQLNVKRPETPYDWRYIVIGISILVLLIIIGQTVCIIHFKRKARAVKIQSEWTSRKERPEDTVRYSKMPVQVIDTEAVQEARESGIYEALENIRVPQKPQPPPLQTLPRKGASHKSAPVSETVEPVTDDSTSQRTFTNGMMLPFNSLQKKKKSPKEPDNKRSSLERIKERPPLPIPDEEIYEVMDNSPAPLRKEIKNIEVQKQGARKKEIPVKKVQKNEEFRGFNRQPRTKPVPDAVNIGSDTQTMKPQELSSQLKEAIHLRKRAIDVIQEPPRPKELPPRVSPVKLGLPPPSALPTRLASPFPRPERSAPSAPVVPKHKPPAPAKPKQLHRLPPIPIEPEPIPVTMEDDDDNEWEEDWTYEPLPNYNIYSI